MMIYEHSNDVKIGPYHFMVYVFAPEQSSPSGSFESGIHAVRYQKGSSYSGLFLQRVEGRSLHAVMFSVEDVLDRLSSIEACVDGVLAGSALQAEDVRAELHRLAQEQGLIISSSTLSISEEAQEDSQSFAMVRVCMAGMPPLVLIEGGHFHFPVRSGIPLGVNDLKMKVQPLELPVHGSLFLHTAPGGRTDELKELHSMLAHFKGEMLPEGVLLFGLHLKRADG